MVAGWRYLSGSANWIWRASLPSRNLFLTSPSESKVRGSRFSIGNIHRRTAERNCSRGSGIRSLLQVGMFALSLVKHSVSSACSDLHICLLPLLLHSPFPQGSIVPLDYFLFDMGETNFPIVQFLRYF